MVARRPSIAAGIEALSGVARATVRQLIPGRARDELVLQPPDAALIAAAERISNWIAAVLDGEP